MSYEVFNPDSEERDDFLKEYIAKFAESVKPQPNEIISNFLIEDVNIEALSLDELSRLYLHYTLKNRGTSIETTGLQARIGRNSRGIDEKIALYFSSGYDAALDNWEVWLRWRLCQLYGPFGAQAAKPSYKPTREEVATITQWGLTWMDRIAKGFDKLDELKLQRTFEYEYAELSNCDYLALDLEPGTDFDPDQEDPKKEGIDLWPYKQSIYYVPICTNPNTMKAERWNMSTPLGEDFTLPALRIQRLTLGNDTNDAYSILKFFYHKYLQACEQQKIKSKAYFMLPRFFAFCDVL